MSNPRDDLPILVKPIWWRQLGFTLFLLVCAFFFALVNFLGTFLSWLITLFMLVSATLNLLDQIFTWSRLKIDHNGYDLRTWWSRKKYSHQEIKSFELDKYMHRQLIVINFKNPKGTNSDRLSLPFPCAFGRSVEDVLKVLRKSLDKTPRPLR